MIQQTVKILLFICHRNGTVELCGDNLQCIFDFQLTGKKEVAEATKGFSERYEAIKKDAAPGNRRESLYELGIV
jgi:hypothetical protein